MAADVGFEELDGTELEAGKTEELEEAVAVFAEELLAKELLADVGFAAVVFPPVVFGVPGFVAGMLAEGEESLTAF